MKVNILQKHKSIPSGLEFDLPDFTILTGRNGSGKSHLLEAIAQSHIASVNMDGIITTSIIHVPYNGLNPQVDERCESAQIAGQASQWWAEVQMISRNMRDQGRSAGEFNDVFSDYIRPHFGFNPARDVVLKTVMKKSGKDIDSLTEADVYDNISYSSNSGGNLFFSQCAMIFKGYQLRWRENKLKKFLVSEGYVEGNAFLSDEDFVSKHGPAPWDLINQVLARAGLPYQFPPPPLSSADLPYTLRLNDESTGTSISVNDLSSGEKVLMSLALAIYNTKEEGSRPELLLIDEPDAPLHPQFSKLLIDTVAETIVKAAGVKVIMTTHSPTTAAMSPDNSLFEMSRDTKIPMMISSGRAVSILTEGIRFLRVSYEKRRQVFVESKYDVVNYERIFDALARKHGYSYQPIFMEPHSGSSNCSDVINIVARLRSAGNDQVWGIVDFDGVNTQHDSLLVVGGGRRYSIESYLLDPLYMVFALVRFKAATFADFGVGGRSQYTDIQFLSDVECQTLIDNFLATIGLAGGDLSDVYFENGFKIRYPQSFLMHNGHEYERLIRGAFPGISAITRNKPGDNALKGPLSEVIAEWAQFLPVELGELFCAMDEQP